MRMKTVIFMAALLLGAGASVRAGQNQPAPSAPPAPPAASDAATAAAGSSNASAGQATAGDSSAPAGQAAAGDSSAATGQTAQGDSSAATGQAGAAGQKTPPQGETAATDQTASLANFLDAGARVTNVSGDPARWQRYRDIRNGVFLDRLRFDRELPSGWFVKAAIDNAGYRDQRYFAEFERPGKVRASFEYNQIPLFYSQDTRSPYTETSAGIFTLPSVLRQAGQAGTITLLGYNSLIPNESPFDTRTGRHIVSAAVWYGLTPDINLDVALKTYTRTGDQMYSASFGFGQAGELAAPIDTRTTDLSAGVEWDGEGRMLRVAYDGSWFTQNVPSITYDNPLRFTDSPAASATGRTAMPPSDTSHTVSGAVMYALPAHSQVTGNLAIGVWRQDATLLPFSSNTTLPQNVVPRSTADTDVRRISANVVVNSRPSPSWGINARYRLYDFDNRTPLFDIPLEQVFDAGAGPIDSPPTAWSHRRNYFDATASYFGLRYATFNVGYTLDHMSQNDREFVTTNDNGIHASVDSANLGIVAVRGIFERTSRSGSGFDPTVLTDAGEHAELQRYDIADRTRTRATAMVQVTPSSLFALSFTAGGGKDDYPNSYFGLQSNSLQTYTAAVNAYPRDQVTLGVSYGYEKYSALQQSRVSNSPPPSAAFNNAANNWQNNQDTGVNYLTANADLLRIFPKTDIRFAYDFNRSNANYVYVLPAGSTVAIPQQWPTLMNSWQSMTIDLRYFIRPRLAAGVTYWLDKYSVSDFQYDPILLYGANPPDLTANTLNYTTLARPGGLFLGYVDRPYTSNSFWFRVMYFW